MSIDRGIERPPDPIWRVRDSRPVRFFSRMGKSPIEFRDERLRLTIPLSDAVSFAMGWSDLDYRAPADHLRHVVGVLAIDELQRSEQWRLASMLQACIAHRWPVYQAD